jgi:hypothetical protein
MSLIAFAVAISAQLTALGVLGVLGIVAGSGEVSSTQTGESRTVAKAKTAWSAAPCGTDFTHAVVVRRTFANDPEELDRLHTLVCESPCVAAWLASDPDSGQISLKLAMKRLIDQGRAGYLCVNVYDGNRFVWLE